MDISLKLFKEMMENESDDCGEDRSENVSEAFICCVCRDLLYKPVVLACGHASCFWCVHRSMSDLRKSFCPICRNKYHHLPSVCQQLHSLLLKMYPAAYKRREIQTLEEEKEMGYCSLQFDGSAYQLQTEETIIEPTDAREPCISGAEPSCNIYSIRTEDISNLQILGEVTVATGAITVKDENLDQIYASETRNLVSVDDVLCGSCMNMLYQPVVLNCGHVFCLSCIVLRTSEVLRCEVCQSPHPSAVPKVCLEFHHFLEEEFPKEYGLRKDTVCMKQEQFQGSSKDCKESVDISFSSGEDPLTWWNADSKVHIGVGCDSCGMNPIIGDRYKCRDCVEEIGYDLCEDCYTNRTKLPGRFNQRHTSQHELEIVELSALRKLMLRLLTGQLQDISAVSNIFTDDLEEDSINIVPIPANDPDEDAENFADTTLASSETDAI